MSDTITQDCNCCQIESDCINGLCESCSDYNYKLQKKADLLTLGLLQEKNKINALLEACKYTKTLLVDNVGQMTHATAMLEAAIAQAEKP